jgi:hypothetical protein
MGYRYMQNSWQGRVKKVNLKEKRTPSSANIKVQQIKACAYCKTHIPEDEGIYKDEQFFCSYQHLDRYLEHNQK